MKRLPDSVLYQQYEREKQDWLYKHPAATHEQYQKAVAEIAKRLGV